MRWRTDTQHDPSLLRTRGVCITPYILSNKLFSFAGLFQHHLHPVAANRTQREVKQHGHHSRYYCTYYCISDAKKRKQKTTKNTSYSSSICLRATQASNKVRPSLPVNLTHLTPEPHTPTSLNQTDIHAMRMSAALQRYKKSAMIVCFLFLNPNSLIQANFALRRWYDTSAMLHFSASPSRSPSWLATFV